MGKEEQKKEKGWENRWAGEKGREEEERGREERRKKGGRGAFLLFLRQ